VAYTLDVTEFETFFSQASDASRDDHAALQTVLEETVALYRGELLPSCYDEWIGPVRERLRQTFMEALERLIWVAEDRRDYATAIHFANQLLTYDPLHEATYRRLMRLHMVEGNRASALRVYHTCAVLLKRELGVEPGLELQQAHASLLEMEIPAVLREAWSKAARDQAHFHLLCGEAGIGKTRLAEELLIWAERQGITTARTRAYAGGQRLAYAPVIEWLQSEPLQASVAHLDDMRLAEVARRRPDLLATHPDRSDLEPPTTTATDPWQRQRLYEALAQAFLSDGRPKLLLIDDLQWCDDETLAWLRYLLRFAQSAEASHHGAVHLLIVGAARPQEVDETHPLTALLLDLHSTEQVTEIGLAPLSLAETAELAAAQVAGSAVDGASLLSSISRRGHFHLFGARYGHDR